MHYLRTSLLLSLTCTALFSLMLVSMEKQEKEYVRHISSLKELCIKNAITELKKSDTVDLFIQGETKYHLLPEDIQRQITPHLLPLCVVSKVSTDKDEIRQGTDVKKYNTFILARKDDVINLKVVNNTTGLHSSMPLITLTSAQKRANPWANISAVNSNEDAVVVHLDCKDRNENSAYFVDLIKREVKEEPSLINHAVHFNGNFIEKRSNTGSILLDGKNFTPVTKHYKEIVSIAFSNQDLVLCKENDAYIFGVMGKNCTITEISRFERVTNMVVSDTGKWLFMRIFDTEKNGYINQLFNVENRKTFFISTSSSEWTFCPSFSHDEHYLLQPLIAYFNIYDLSSIESDMINVLTVFNRFYRQSRLFDRDNEALSANFSVGASNIEFSGNFYDYLLDLNCCRKFFSSDKKEFHFLCLHELLQKGCVREIKKEHALEFERSYFGNQYAVKYRNKLLRIYNFITNKDVVFRNDIEYFLMGYADSCYFECQDGKAFVVSTTPFATITDYFHHRLIGERGYTKQMIMENSTLKKLCDQFSEGKI